MDEIVKELGQTLTEKDFSALMNALNQTVLVSVTDVKGNILYANKKFVEVSKYELLELLGQNHRLLKSGHQSDELFATLWKTIVQGEIWRGEIKNRAKDGSYYCVDTSISPIMNNFGKPERYIGIGFLISDKKEIEEDRDMQIRNLEKMNKFMVGRELKMVELKEKIKVLENSNLGPKS